MFIAALSFAMGKIMDRIQMSINWWMDKEEEVYMYTVKCYSAIKKNEILPFAPTWIELEGITLSEIRQSEKDKYHIISLMCNLRNKENEHKGGKKIGKPRSRILTTESKLMVYQREGG